MRLLKSGLTVRGDSVYCPLSFTLDSYWNCLTDCHHCFFRRLNQVWGKDLRPLDVELFEKKLRTGLKNKNPKTPLASSIAQKKTIRIGSKTDPFQTCERTHQITKKVMNILIQLRWSFVIQTRFTEVMMEYEELIRRAGKKGLITALPIISPGGEGDWELFERKRTTKPADRMKHLRRLRRWGIPIGVNGEPFIPGYHTPKDFEETMKWLKSNGIPSYNTYNLHLNDYVAKRLVKIGLDIEKIWEGNQDGPWKATLSKLIDIAKKYDIKLGCPDFVNTGPNYREPANTCCGINVPNPTTFNTHHWKKMVQDGLSFEEILEKTWDGVGDYEQGKTVLMGQSKTNYTLYDSGVLGLRGNGYKGLI